MQTHVAPSLRQNKQESMRHTLATMPDLDPGGGQIALLWNTWVRAHVVWRDADVGQACRAFFLAHLELQRDGALHRLFVSHVLMLHEYRLLTPDQIQQILAPV